MMTREVNDLDINRHIRQVFVRYWIDLGRLSIRTTGGVIMIRGLLQKVPGSGAELNSSTVSAIFSDIRRIQGVKRVQTELANWVNTGEGWQPGAGTVGEHIGETSQNEGGTWSMSSEK